MPITITGPAWPSVEALRARLAAVPETGTFNLGGHRIDAIEQLTRLRAAGLRVPDFTTDVDVARAWVREGRSVFGRNLTHTQGRDIVGPRDRRWAGKDWWSAVVPNVHQEWRIHILGGRAIGRGLKVQVEPPWRKLPVRSRNNGWHMRHDVDPPEGLRKIAKLAVRAVGYDHGAVDMLVTSAELKVAPTDVVVLEINLVPSMRSPYTLDAYVAAIRAWVARQQPATA